MITADSSIKLSVIVPCYKVEKYLPECLDSLINQTLDDIEIICINDGSPDGCIDILRSYEAANPGKVVVIDKKNEGVWRGRFDGIRIAKGEYIGFVDSDDTVAPNFAEVLYRSAKESDADISVCGFKRIDLDTKKVLSVEMCSPREDFVISEEPGRLIELNGAPWNKVFRSSILKSMNDLEEPPTVLDDLAFHLLVYLEARGKVVFSDVPLINYMVRADSIINTVRKEQVDSIYRTFGFIRSLYLERGVSEDMLKALDGMAFLHLGVSLLFRLFNDPTCDVTVYISRCTSFLDDKFSTWRKSNCMSLSYALKQRGPFIKLWIARLFYKAHLIRPFLSAYRFVITKLRIDIKW